MLLSSLLFCISSSTETPYCSEIVHSDSPDCTVCCVDASASWLAINAAAPEAAVTANANFFKRTPPHTYINNSF